MSSRKSKSPIASDRYQMVSAFHGDLNIDRETGIVRRLVTFVPIDENGKRLEPVFAYYDSKHGGEAGQLHYVKNKRPITVPGEVIDHAPEHTIAHIPEKHRRPMNADAMVVIGKHTAESTYSFASNVRDHIKLGRNGSARVNDPISENEVEAFLKQLNFSSPARPQQQGSSSTTPPAAAAAATPATPGRVIKSAIKRTPTAPRKIPVVELETEDEAEDEAEAKRGVKRGREQCSTPDCETRYNTRASGAEGKARRRVVFADE